QAVGVLLPALKGARDSGTFGSLEQGLASLWSVAPPAKRRPRAATAASAVAFPAGTGHPLAALTLLISAPQPPPCRLTTQQLVELRRVPPCIDESRRVILDQLGTRYKLYFADVWEFVRFADEQHLGLDFTTPPQRPEQPTGPQR